MSDDRSGEAAVAAGAIAGIAGFGVFLVAHQLWIVPIWFIAPVGVVMAVVGGAAVGTSFAALRPRLPRRPWTAPAVAALFASMLAPAVLIGELRGPTFALDADGGGTLLVPPTEALVDVLLGLLGASSLAGAIAGGLIGRHRRAVGATTLAAIALAIGPGHNIPLLGGTPAVGKELAILGAVVVAASVVLVESEARLSAGARWRRVKDQGPADVAPKANRPRRPARPRIAD
ncbi:MAG TPA: hypothetical protein VFR14_09735 [Candidatus Limnocylindrales bacterium]|nr:hypothetical protein [Candidatus Limnocylindrales bacterium]